MTAPESALPEVRSLEVTSGNVVGQSWHDVALQPYVMAITTALR
jgi:hypothetical protein